MNMAMEMAMLVGRWSKLTEIERLRDKSWFAAEKRMP